MLEFGTGTVITRNISACRAKDDKTGIQKNVSTVWSITCILAGIIFAAGIVFFLLFNRIYNDTFTLEQIRDGKRIFLVILAYLLVSFFANTINGIILGYERYEIKPTIAIVRSVLRVVLLVSMVLAVRKSIAIALVDLILAIAVDAFLILYCRKELKIRFRFREIDWNIFRSSLPLATAIFIQVLVNQANMNVDKFVIGIRIGPKDVAVYGVGLYIYSLFSSLTTIPITMYGPHVVKEITIGRPPSEVSMHLVQPSRLIVLIGGTILFGFFAVGKQFIILVYGASYVIAWKIALIIMFPMLINMSNGILINILDATDKRMARSWLLLATTAANILLTFCWIERYGILGACTATAICTMIGQVILMDVYYFCKLKIKVLTLKWRTYRGIIPYQIISGGIGFLVGKSIEKTVMSFIAGGAAYAVSFCFMYFFIGANEREKEAVLKLLNKIIRR